MKIKLIEALNFEYNFSKIDIHPAIMLYKNLNNQRTRA